MLNEETGSWYLGYLSFGISRLVCDIFFFFLFYVFRL